MDYAFFDKFGFKSHRAKSIDLQSINIMIAVRQTNIFHFGSRSYAL